MDARAFGPRTSAQKNFMFLHSQRWGESLWVGTSARISAWTSAGYPAEKLSLWVAFAFLRDGLGVKRVPPLSDSLVPCHSFCTPKDSPLGTLLSHPQNSPELHVGHMLHSQSTNQAHKPFLGAHNECFPVIDLCLWPWPWETVRAKRGGVTTEAGKTKPINVALRLCIWRQSTSWAAVKRRGGGEYAWIGTLWQIGVLTWKAPRRKQELMCYLLCCDVDAWPCSWTVLALKAIPVEIPSEAGGNNQLLSWPPCPPGAHTFNSGIRAVSPVAGTQFLPANLLHTQRNHWCCFAPPSGAKSSGPFLVNFGQYFLILLKPLVTFTWFQSFLVNFSQF